MAFGPGGRTLAAVDVSTYPWLMSNNLYYHHLAHAGPARAPAVH